MNIYTHLCLTQEHMAQAVRACTGRYRQDDAPGPESHSLREIAYSTSPCSSPGMDTGQSATNSRTRRIPDFSMTRREAVFTAMVEATTRCTPNSMKPLAISARDPSVAYPFPHA